MEELKRRAINIAQEQDIKILRERLPTYPASVNNIEWDEKKDNLGQLRYALIKHINTTIGKNSTDLEIFINHFG